MTAEQVYVDPSALISLYIHEARSRDMNRWRRRTPGALPVTLHGRMEIVNGIALAAFQKRISVQDAVAGWNELDADFADGHYEQVNSLWRATLNTATDLSRMHTASLGLRSLDILHVSAALELGLRSFFSLDQRQTTLARVVGLKVIRL